MVSKFGRLVGALVVAFIALTVSACSAKQVADAAGQVAGPSSTPAPTTPQAAFPKIVTLPGGSVMKIIAVVPEGGTLALGSKLVATVEMISCKEGDIGVATVVNGKAHYVGGGTACQTIAPINTSALFDESDQLYWDAKNDQGVIVSGTKIKLYAASGATPQIAGDALVTLDAPAQ